MKLSLLAVAFAVLSAPAFADTAMDPATLTCKDMLAMDAAGMLTAGTAIQAALKDDAKLAAMTAEEATKAAGDACTANPDALVIDAVKM